MRLRKLMLLSLCIAGLTLGCDVDDDAGGGGGDVDAQVGAGGDGGAGGEGGGAGGEGGGAGGEGGGAGGEGGGAGGGDCRDVPAVDPRDPLYDRYEGTGFNNGCQADADCVPAGCSGEICAADPDLGSTCEEVPLPGGDCGCVQGECIWHVEQCGPCADADGDGVCDADDSDCNADGTPLMCRIPAPACREGTVPEIREGCYTGECVTWLACGQVDPGPARCGGIQGLECPDRLSCVDDPTDDCAPPQGADCGGLCVPPEQVCAPVAFGEFGDCRAIIGWGIGAEGVCQPISGCECDADCAGRVYPDERSCLAACGDAPCVDTDGDGICDADDRECNVDGQQAQCERVAPPCEDGTVPEVDNLCYTGRCVTWDMCERDDPGPEPAACGGFVGARCAEGTSCVDDPRDDCAPPRGADCPGLCIDDATLCAPVRAGEFGACEAIIGWGVSPEGRCFQVSGCGCDIDCAGRVFATEAECADACAEAPCVDSDGDGICDGQDAICNPGGGEIFCDALPPRCVDGAVPVALNGCWTGQCASWRECATIDPPVECRNDADGDGICDREDPHCNPDGVALNCRRMAPDCPAGTVPELADGCYTDNCLVWDECGEPPMCMRAPSVSRESRFYDRFEGTNFANACRVDADCVVSGCSAEVCAAEAVFTTCEGLPEEPAGNCGCVEGQCQWHTCEPGEPGPVECAPIEPGEFGDCRAIIGWGIGADGQCGIVSGCGCDARCDGRVFPDEATCQRACDGGVDPEPQACGGFAGLRCPAGQSCADDPRDDCAPPRGADCPGICVDEAAVCSPVRDGEFGQCEAVIGWAANARGGCSIVSGCGCDENCAGRVFPDEATCLGNCGRAIE